MMLYLKEKQLLEEILFYQKLALPKVIKFKECTVELFIFYQNIFSAVKEEATLMRHFVTLTWRWSCEGVKVKGKFY